MWLTYWNILLTSNTIIMTMVHPVHAPVLNLIVLPVSVPLQVSVEVRVHVNFHVYVTIPLQIIVIFIVPLQVPVCDETILNIVRLSS